MKSRQLAKKVPETARKVYVKKQEQTHLEQQEFYFEVFRYVDMRN